MKIVSTVFTIGAFALLSGQVMAQNGEKPVAEKPVAEKPATETPKVQPPEKCEQDKGKAPEEGKENCGNCADKQAVSGTKAGKDVDLSKGMKLKDFTPISDILAAPEKFEGKRVLVKGPAVGVCESRGCWVKLRSEKSAKQALRVKVEDGEIVFPMTVMGNEVQAEGIVEKTIYPIEVVRDAYKRQAEAKGEKFDPESVKEPLVVWQLKGLGAKFDAPKEAPKETPKDTKPAPTGKS